MALTDISVKRPIATTMVFLIIIVLGILSFHYLPVDLLPPIEYPQLTVATDYPNVGPEEIEKIITKPVENAVAGVPGIDKVHSRSEEGDSRVTLEFSQGTDLDVAANDVRAALDRLRDDMPPEAEQPRIWKFNPNNFPVVIVGANSDMNLQKLTQVLEREVTKRFEQIPGAGSIDVWGGVHKNVQVNLKRDRLIASGLSSAQVEEAIAGENVNLAGGNVNSGIHQLYVRTKGEYQSLNQISNTIITTVDDKPIRVRDVADVKWGYEDLDRLVKIDKKPMVRFGVRKQSGANTVAVAKHVREEIARINKERDDMHLFVTTDQSKFIQNSINNVQNSAIWGSLLAILILYLFLRNGSSTAIIAVAIPISVIATFGLLYFNGLTLNQMSFGGLALGVGLIVDNAIVVLESIIRMREEQGKDLKTSALVGTKEVAGAIVASTLTTCVIFLPVVFMQTISGLIFKQLALVVVFSIICSLFVALTIVPMLSSRFLTNKPDTDKNKGRKSWFQRKFNRFEEKYVSLLKKALDHKAVVFTSTAVVVVACLLLIPLIPVELAPKTDADEIDIDFDMADGINIAVQNQYLQELSDIVRANLPMKDVDHLTTEVREGHAQVEVEMVSAGKRSISTSILADKLRKKLQGVVPGGQVRVDAQSGLWILRRLFNSGGDNEAVQVQLRGYNLAQAKQISKKISLRMQQIPEISGVQVGQGEGQPEQNISFDRDKISDLGLSIRQVAQVIQTNIGGSRAGTFRQEGDQYPIMVRLQPKDRLSATDLSNISIRTPSGQALPISAVVSKASGRGPTDIHRIDGQRVSYISANLKSGVALNEAMNKIRAKLSDLRLPRGFSIFYGGEFQEQQKAASDFRLSIIMALILVYMVMAAQFERFFDPLVVMFSVPLAVIGVVPILLLTQTTINMQSLMGLMMLIGIVVNNAIVLIDYINLLRRDRNMPIREAILTSGKLRLRPILMTTLTTVLGLVPLSFAFGSGGEIQASLARVVIGGLTASTLVTLIFIPVVYMSMENLFVKVRSYNWNSFLIWRKNHDAANA